MDINVGASSGICQCHWYIIYYIFGNATSFKLFYLMIIAHQLCNIKNEYKINIQWDSYLLHDTKWLEVLVVFLIYGLGYLRGFFRYVLYDVQEVRCYSWQVELEHRFAYRSPIWLGIIRYVLWNLQC